MNTTQAVNKQLCDAKNMLKSYKLDFASETGWATILEHVETHREILEEEHGITANWCEAVFSWHEEIFVPLYRSISTWAFRHAFSDQKMGDLYLAVSDHWAYLKERDPKTTAPAAARSFLEHYGHGLSRHFSRFLISEVW